MNRVNELVDAGACDDQCREFAECLEGKFTAQEHIVGTGDLSLFFNAPQVADAGATADAGAGPDAGAGLDAHADPPTGRPVSDCQAADPIITVPNCNSSGAATAECTNINTFCDQISSLFFIEISDRIKHSTYSGSDVACKDFFAKPYPLPRLPAGKLTVEIRVHRRGTIQMPAQQSNAEKDAGAKLERSMLGVDETTGCLTLESHNVLIRAGGKANRAVSLTRKAYRTLQDATKDPAMAMFSEPCVRQTQASPAKNFADAGSGRRP